MLDALADPIVAADVSNRVIYANRAVETLLGWSAPELIGEPLVSLIPERFRPTHVAAFERFMATGQGRIIGRPIRVPALTRTGEELDVELTISAFSDPSGGRLVVASLHDLRERVELERQMVEEEQRSGFLAEAGEVLASSLEYETTLSNVAQLAVARLADWCLVDIDEGDGRLRRVATAHRDPSRVPFVEEFERRYPPDEEHPPPALRVIESGEPVLVPEITAEMLRASARDDEQYQMLLELAPLSYMCVPLRIHNRTLGALTFLTGASSRRIYGPAELSLAEELARRAAAAMDNARLYRELQESIRIRDEFLSSISHDLKNPLATIKARAQILRRRAVRAPSEESQRMVDGLESIDLTAAKMSRLIDDLVDLVHLRIGRPLTLHRADIDLVELVRQVAEDQSTTHSRAVQVEEQIELLAGSFDAARIERVLVNLLSNAIKYSPEGGDITVSIGEEGSAGGPLAVIAVSDQGIGIPANELQSVFERFFRASNAASFAGTGIGLAGALQIVEQHGGTMSVESEEGKGTTFTVRLPLAGGE